MTFGVPLFLLATLAAAIPVLLHMISRQRAKQLPFSTLRFLRISVEKTRRRRRLHDVALMLLRAAALLLIALGLARPTLTRLAALWGGADSAVVVVLDNSASMGQVDQERARVDTALGAAGEIFRQLSDADEVALLITNGPAHPETRQLGHRQDKIRQVLNQVKPSYGRADLTGAVAEARELLAKSTAVNRQIFILSDVQATSWEGFSPSAAPKDEATPDPKASQRAIPMVVVDCARAPKANVGVRDVRVESTAPVAGVLVQVTVELQNMSTVAQQRHVELLLDGVREADSPMLELSPEGRARYTLSCTPQQSGLHRGEVRLVGQDGSALDDRRYFAIEVGQGIPVAIVKPARHEISCLETSFYVERALAPEEKGGWALEAKSLTLAELPSEPLATYRVVYLVDVPALEQEAAERLADYVKSGGNVVWICGDNVDPATYNRMSEVTHGALLPAALLDMRTPEKGRDSWHISELDHEHPATRPFLEPASLYQSVLVTKYVRLDTKAAPDARVLGRLDSGDPVLVQRRVGEGSVTLWATSAHVGWTNWPLRPIFLPLLLRMTFELAGAESARHAAFAGAPLVVPLESRRPSSVEVQPPSGALVRLPVNGADNTFRYSDTHDIGIYRVRLQEADKSEELAFAVNLDPEELEPKKLDRQEFQARLGTTPLVWADNPDDLADTFRLLREGKNLWDVFLWAVLAVLVGETLIANRASRG